MSNIRGLFEPFATYVTTQLTLRRAILAEQGLQSKSSFEDQQLVSSNIDTLGAPGTSTRESFNSLGDEAWNKIATKSCTIRMSSGVDIEADDNVLEEQEKKLIGEKLAKRWALVGGDSTSFEEDKENPTFAGGAYGNPVYRGDAKDGFGIVANPGIIDAVIDTKSDDGSLREATVNFVCHNRRQLEILEALYMRPGYPILLEWGWVPYLTNYDWVNGQNVSEVSIESSFYSPLEDFFDQNSTLEDVNKEISKRKKISGGNYDGFVGYCKNFLFKVREDGGYDCTTEIIAHGEILESLKSNTAFVPSLSAINFGNYRGKDVPIEKEAIDEFLFYLYSIKAQLDKPGDRYYIKYSGKRDDDGQIIAPPTSALKGTMYDVTMWDEIGYGKTKEEIMEETGMSEGVHDFLESLSETINGFLQNPFGTDRSVTQHVYDLYDADDQRGDVIIRNIQSLYNDASLSPQYIAGWTKIEDMVKDVSKCTPEDLDAEILNWNDIPSPIGELGTYRELTFNPYSINDPRWYSEYNANPDELGLDARLQGTILKQIAYDDATENETGTQKNIYVRWDLICQILNKLITPEYKANHNLVELTYVSAGGETYKRGNPDQVEGKKWPGGDMYIPYPKPKATKIVNQGIPHVSEPFQLKPNIENQNLNLNTQGPQGQLDPDFIEPLLGQSFDHSICIMPHELKRMKPSIQAEADEKITNDDGYGVEILDPTSPNYGKESIVKPTTGTNVNKNFTSFENTVSDQHSVGLVFFNLDHLIQRYEELRMEEYKTDKNGETKYKKRLKKEFNFHDYITTIWNDVNDACAGHYDFGLHTEHENPHKVRVIDFTFSGGTNDTPRQIFQFNPQGLTSLARASHFQSKIDNDFAATISIAAQVPNDIHSLSSLSFKAFHKGIKNRFTSNVKDEKEISRIQELALETLKTDFKEYQDALKSLLFYEKRKQNSNYETELTVGYDEKEKYRKPMSADIAKAYAASLEEKRISLERRHGEYGPDGKLNDGKDGRPFAGQFREDTTYYRNAIIPLTVSMTLDGISGIIPLNIFKIHPEKLPIGYQNENICFVIKKETHKITAGQDWTTDITGYLSLLDDNPNLGENTYNEGGGNIDNITISQLDNLDDQTEGEVMEYPPVPENDANFGAVANDPDFDGSATENTPGARLAVAYNSEVGTDGAYRVYGTNATHQHDWNGIGHCGQDLHAPKGTRAYWPVTGVVVHKGTASSVSGLRSSVRRESDGLIFWGGHFDVLGDYEIGDTVSAGDFWGTVGNTGNATGTSAHIHFNIYEESGGYCGGSIDPQAYFESVYPNFTFE